MITFQEMIRRLTQFWEKQGCIVHQGYDLEVGAGTMNPATFLRCLGPEPYRAAYIEPCRRPTDGRYGKNPNRLQHYFQYQVILKPSPLNLQELYIESLKALGVDLTKHDLRFVHDDWENPTIGAWGLGWEVWIDGMEITQYTYFQSVGGVPVKPVTGELTYGIERLGMYLQNVDSIFDLKWNDFLTYGDIYLRNEIEWSHYNFEEASTDMWFQHFNNFEQEAKKLADKNLPIPAYEFVMKCSHAFNLLDARGAISVSERTKYIGRIRELAKRVAEGFIKSREQAGFPLSQTFPQIEKPKTYSAAIPQNLLDAKATEKDDFLLEIGSEELPASFIPIGQENLERDVKKLLESEGVPYDSIEVYGSPRRLAVLIRGLTKSIAEKSEEKRGPTLDKAFDANGNPSPAGQGFFRSIGKEGIPLSSLQSNQDSDLSIQELKGVSYLFGKQRIPGRATAQILAGKLPNLILNLDFPKKMRWADVDITYPRPIRWIVALFGDQVVPIHLDYLSSGNQSWGHRQLDPNNFVISHASRYLEVLKQHHVMVDATERRELIHTQLDALEKKLGKKIFKREQVLPQVVNLVEWPQVTEATFNPNFLSAPKEVLISEMVEHQKYFPVADDNGNLSPYFIITADTTPSENIKRGNQKVLSSRLSDGVFLYEKGLMVTFAEYNEKLKSVTFLSGFGSLYDKVERLKGHMETLQEMLGISTPEKAKRAAELSKADLVSEMVFEFPELQGTIGRYYALKAGEDPEVSKALEEQWMPRGEKEPLPETETGILLSLADKIDNLLCCFAGNLKPSSSSDPYALRRQVLGMIKILIQGKYPLLFQEIFSRCSRHFLPKQIPQPQQVVGEIEEFFINRIKTIFLDYGLEKDEIEASLSNSFEDIYDTFCKVQALHRFRSSGEAFTRLFEVYKRAKGQINNHAQASVAPHLFVELAEKELYTLVSETRQKLLDEIQGKNYDEAYALIAKLQPALARLFDEVRILAEDAAIRENRIALLQDVFSLFAQLLDFGKIR